MKIVITSIINPKTKSYVKVGGKNNVVPQAIKAFGRWTSNK